MTPRQQRKVDQRGGGKRPKIESLRFGKKKQKRKGDQEIPGE